MKRVYVNEDDYNDIMDFAKKMFIKNKQGKCTFAEALKVKLKDTGW